MPKRKLDSDEKTSSEKLKEDDNTDECQSTEESASSNASLVSSLAIMKRLERIFFDVPCTELAKRMLGKLLVRNFTHPDGTVSEMVARIVETEAYLGGEDKASHSYKGKQTPKNKAMFMAPGTAYVYSIHMYVCINISAKNDGAAVLIRACEPITGSELMIKHRTSNKKLKFKELCNGPSKLCIALSITKESFNQVDLTSCGELYLADDNFGEVNEKEIISCPRIGIGNYAEEWTDKPLRFYISSSDHVSVKYKKK